MSLVPVPSDVCAGCAGRLVERRWSEQPLLRHGGYGAARLTALRVCEDCGDSYVAERGEERPG